MTQNLKDFLIIGLLGLLAFKFLFPGKTQQVQPIIITTTDTTFVDHQGQVNSRPDIINIIPPTSIPLQYLPDTNIAVLRQQFEQLRDKYLSKNIQQDELKIDTLGWVKTIDTVQENKIVGRKWDYSIKERIINTTTTITQPEKKRNQVYVGFDVGGSSSQLVNQADLAVYLKNKKDQMLGISVGQNFQLNELQAKIKFATKISFRK